MAVASTPGATLAATTGGTSQIRQTPVNRFSELSSEDFIKIIFTELANQDPLQPSDSSALLQQMQSIRSIESDMQLTEKLESLVFENQLAGAGNMLGKFIVGRTAELDHVSGVAVAVVREGEAVSLELDNGFRVPVTSIEEVMDAQALSAIAAGATGPADT